MEGLENIKKGNKMKVNRTKEGTMFEVVCGVLVLIMWIVALVLYKNSPDTVPTHFDIAGNADATGDKFAIIIMAIVGTVVTAVSLLAAYKPDRMINIPFEVSTTVQYEKMVRMVRVLAVEMALLFIIVILMVGEKIVGAWPIAVAVGALLLTTVVYCVRIYRLRGVEDPKE